MHSRREFLKTSSLALGFVGCMGFVGRALALPRKILPVWDGVTKVSAVTCPACKKKTQVTMSSENATRVFHCPNCLTWLSPKKGDHCIFDSYGSVKCQAIQIKTRRANNLPV